MAATVSLLVDSKSRANIRIHDDPHAPAAADRRGQPKDRPDRHTLRYYDQEGLLPDPVQRDSARHRVFTEEQVQWLLVCSKMRSSGISLSPIRRYPELQRRGQDTVRDRYEILREHEQKVRDQLAELQEALDIIEHKTAFYAQRMADGTADELWRSGPQCSAQS